MRALQEKRIRRILRIVKESDGQNLIEVALAMPFLILLMAYAVDFGYFFMAAATITSAARNAAQYSVLGYSAPPQGAIAPAGPASTGTSVTAVAMADLASLIASSTTTSVQVCSKANGMSGSMPNCVSYGTAGGSYTPALDPEAPTFVLQRVDVTYTVQPPIPLSFFKYPMLPSLQFHRQVSMRAMD